MPEEVALKFIVLFLWKKDLFLLADYPHLVTIFEVVSNFDEVLLKLGTDCFVNKTEKEA